MSKEKGKGERGRDDDLLFVPWNSREGAFLPHFTDQETNTQRPHSFPKFKQ